MKKKISPFYERQGLPSGRDFLVLMCRKAIHIQPVNQNENPKKDISPKTKTVIIITGSAYFI